MSMPRRSQVLLDAVAVLALTACGGGAGTYTFYCSVPGHRSSMEGTLTVG